MTRDKGIIPTVNTENNRYAAPEGVNANKQADSDKLSERQNSKQCEATSMQKSSYCCDPENCCNPECGNLDGATILQRALGPSLPFLYR